MRRTILLEATVDFTDDDEMREFEELIENAHEFMGNKSVKFLRITVDHVVRIEAKR